MPAAFPLHPPALSRGWYRWPLLLATIVILTLGAVEDVYGNTDAGDVYGSDAVQYLDIARAISRHDARSALNPLWSQGYPALLACVRVAFPAGPGGDWWTSRTTNFVSFALSYGAYLLLLFTLLPPPADGSVLARRPWRLRVGACLLLFTALQTCLGQVSRVNPDELVAAMFLLACALLVRLHRQARLSKSTSWRLASALGLILGVGFLIKAIFLPLGCGMLAIAFVALWRRRARRRPLLAAAAIFAGFLVADSAALSHAAGYRTLGEAGDINYAWHVDRLQKWVHWQGGVQPASDAWPRPSLARFAQWSTRPPDFGKPTHPSAILQRSPTVYGFAAPVHATYVPYFDPPFFYRGYRHVFRVRYQLIAIFKSLGDLGQVLLKHPILGALAPGLALFLWSRLSRRSFLRALHELWPIAGSSLLGILYYLPVHLEGRYLTGMLLVLGTCAILAVPGDLPRPAIRTALALLCLGFLTELAVYQGPVWRNLLHHKAPENNIEWQMGRAASGQHLPPDAPVGVIAWTPNLHCDWAYIAHLQITSEIASGPDYDQFWRLPPDRQAATLATFRRAGAVAVFVNGKPPGRGGPEWRELDGTPLWMARLP